MIKFGKKFETPKKKLKNITAAKEKAVVKENYNHGLASKRANAIIDKKP